MFFFSSLFFLTWAVSSSLSLSLSLFLPVFTRGEISDLVVDVVSDGLGGWARDKNQHQFLFVPFYFYLFFFSFYGVFLRLLCPAG